ncbi:MAG: patatin-like phospholipase family protein [Streptosporangiales bacterium]|nr:patatin-like phospholipase family protein [Streptosporangiales bacterium]
MAETTAFVLGGGGVLGAAEVGMVGALLDAGIRPDLVVGTSIGAINGAIVAADPGPGAGERLAALWNSPDAQAVFGASAVHRLRTLAKSGTHLHPAEPLRRMLTTALGDATFEDLALPFECCAASIERAAEHWFRDGPVCEAVLASCAVPGLLPPVRIGDEHFLDGGLVNSIPVARAVELGATRLFVMQVGRIDRPLTPPRKPWEVALVAFEIARRHRFARDMAALPDGTRAHVLPTGDPLPPRYDDLSSLKYRDFSTAPIRIRRAYAATADYLRENI